MAQKMRAYSRFAVSVCACVSLSVCLVCLCVCVYASVCHGESPLESGPCCGSKLKPQLGKANKLAVRMEHIGQLPKQCG